MKGRGKNRQNTPSACTWVEMHISYFDTVNIASKYRNGSGCFFAYLLCWTAQHFDSFKGNLPYIYHQIVGYLFQKHKGKLEYEAVSNQISDQESSIKTQDSII